MKLESNIRPIIKGRIGNLESYFLLDTGSNLALLDISLAKNYNLEIGNIFPGNVIGAGGEVSQTYFCKNKVTIGKHKLDNFILTDLTLIRLSILRETGINILGVISYPQIQSLDIIINPTKNEINGI